MTLNVSSHNYCGIRNYHCQVKSLHFFPLRSVTSITTESPLIKQSWLRLCCAYPPQTVPSSHPDVPEFLSSLQLVARDSTSLHVKITKGQVGLKISEQRSTVVRRAI